MKNIKVKIEFCTFCMISNQVCFESKSIVIGREHKAYICVNCINDFKNIFHKLELKITNKYDYRMER
jgi:hypothetical protein